MVMAKRKIAFTPKKAQYVQQFKVDQVKGTTLTPSVAVADRYARKLQALIDKMHREAYRQLIGLFKHPDYAMDARDYAGVGEDASIASRARILTNQLTDTFTALFGGVATALATETVDQTNDNAATTLGSSLRDLSGGVTFATDFISEGVQDVITASVAANVDLIKRIPEKYMSDVTGQVMRSITTGNGLADLQPFMNKAYGSQKRQAQLTAMDQTRKAYTAINTARMESLGVDRFEWVHSSGSKEPRPYHLHTLNGNVYSISDPPIINPKTGQRGLPGDEPNCHCTMRPIVSFD